MKIHSITWDVFLFCKGENHPRKPLSSNDTQLPPAYSLLLGSVCRSRLNRAGPGIPCKGELCAFPVISEVDDIPRPGIMQSRTRALLGGTREWEAQVTAQSISERSGAAWAGVATRADSSGSGLVLEAAPATGIPSS